MAQAEVSIQCCVKMAGEPMQRLTPLALVSVVGGASSAAAVRVEPDQGYVSRRKEAWGADEHTGTTRPLPALARPSLSASQLATKPCPVRGLRLLTEDVVAAPGVAASTATPVAVALPVAPVRVAPVRATPSAAEPVPAAKQPSLAQPAAAPVAPRAVAAPEAKRELFRRVALDAHYGTDLEALAEPKAGAWTVLLVLTSLVALLFVGSALLSIEVTVKAPGALRAPNGLRSLESVLSGAITEVLAQAGDEVEAGQVVARLEEAQLESTLTLRERELEVLRAGTSSTRPADGGRRMRRCMPGDGSRLSWRLDRRGQYPVARARASRPEPGLDR